MFSFRLILGVLYGLLVITIGVLSRIVYQSNRDSFDKENWISHTHEVIETTYQITELYEDILVETSNLSKHQDTVTLHLIQTLTSALHNKVGAITEQTRDNALQQDRIKDLKFQISELEVFTDSLRKAADGKLSNVLRIERWAGLRYKIKNMIDPIREEEQRLLVLRNREFQQSVASRNRYYIELIFGFAVLLASSFFIIRYNFRKRIRVEKELKEANELFSKLFSSSPVGGLLCRADNFVIMDCNDAYAQVVHSSRDSIIGKPPVFVEALRPEQKSEVTAAMRDDRAIRDMEVSLSIDDEIKWLSISLVSVQISNVACIRLVVQDVTSHKEAELATKAALAREMELSKIKSDFITLASHEFRTPLTSIGTSASLIEKLTTGDEQERLSKHVRRIKTSVGTLSTILNEFISVTQIDEGKVELVPERINVAECVADVCESVKPYVRSGQNIVCHHTGERDVYLDRGLLEVALTNLLINALKYSPIDSTVELRSTERDDVLEITIRDQGIGIPLEDQRNLFQRFFRSSNAGNVQGTGLGLYITKHYVEKMNGSITVKSEPAKGTEVRLVFTHPFPAGERSDKSSW